MQPTVKVVKVRASRTQLLTAADQGQNPFQLPIHVCRRVVRGRKMLLVMLAFAAGTQGQIWDLPSPVPPMESPSRAHRCAACALLVEALHLHMVESEESDYIDLVEAKLHDIGFVIDILCRKDSEFRSSHGALAPEACSLVADVERFGNNNKNIAAGIVHPLPGDRLWLSSPTYEGFFRKRFQNQHPIESVVYRRTYFVCVLDLGICAPEQPSKLVSAAAILGKQKNKNKKKKEPRDSGGDGRCARCLAVVGDLHHVLQRYPRPWHLNDVRQSLETVCSRLKWRHERQIATLLESTCDDLIDEYEDEITAALMGTVASALSPGQVDFGQESIMGICMDALHVCRPEDSGPNALAGFDGLFPSVFFGTATPNNGSIAAATVEESIQPRPFANPADEL